MIKKRLSILLLMFAVACPSFMNGMEEVAKKQAEKAKKGDSLSKLVLKASCCACFGGLCIGAHYLLDKQKPEEEGFGKFFLNEYAKPWAKLTGYTLTSLFTGFIFRKNLKRTGLRLWKMFFSWGKKKVVPVMKEGVKKVVKKEGKKLLDGAKEKGKEEVKKRVGDVKKKVMNPINNVGNNVANVVNFIPRKFGDIKQKVIGKKVENVSSSSDRKKVDQEGGNERFRKKAVPVHMSGTTGNGGYVDPNVFENLKKSHFGSSLRKKEVPNRFLTKSMNGVLPGVDMLGTLNEELNS